LESAFAFGPEDGGGEVFAFAGAGHFVKALEDGHIRLNGTEGEFAAKVFAEGFRRDPYEAGDFVLRDAARGKETGQLSVFSGAEKGAAGAL
jgi:hypothetical protein